MRGVWIIIFTGIVALSLHIKSTLGVIKSTGVGDGFIIEHPVISNLYGRAVHPENKRSKKEENQTQKKASVGWF